LKKLFLGLYAIGILALGVNEVSADTLNEPIDVQSVTAFQDIYDEGSNVNFIFSVRYNMPQSSWYPFLKDQSGCESQTPSTTILCSFPETLSSSIATIGLYKHALSSTITDTIVSNASYGSDFTEPVRVIGNTLFGLNISGNAETGIITGIDKTLEQLIDDGSVVCIVSYNVFTPIIPQQNYSCADIQDLPNISTQNIGTQKERLIKHIQDNLLDITIDESLPDNTLINQNAKVTGNGVIITRRVSPLLQQVLPELFDVGLTDLVDVPPPFATSTLETTLQTELETQDIYSAAVMVGKQYFGMEAPVFLSFTLILVAIITGAGMYLLSGNSIFGIVFGFAGTLVTGVFIAPPLLQPLLVGMFVGLIGMVIYLVRKIPS
tara:strand:- start:5870 stop:7003 length:1134 start_codon:yes stop_codon:yes gene_type:complete